MVLPACDTSSVPEIVQAERLHWNVWGRNGPLNVFKASAASGWGKSRAVVLSKLPGEPGKPSQGNGKIRARENFVIVPCIYAGGKRKQHESMSLASI